MRRHARGLVLVFAALALTAQPYASIEAPVIVAKCAPRYTEEAKRSKLEGKVLLYAEISPNGQAVNIKVIQRLGMGLDENAVQAVKQWRFSPGTRDGKPVVVPANLEVTFRLNDQSEPCRAGPPQVEERPGERRT